MNRIIKFRGKGKTTGEWVYGGICFDNSGRYFIIKEIHANEFDNPSTARQQIYFCEVAPETVGQFTGLYDSTKWDGLTKEEQNKWLSSGKTEKEWDGKEIYEAPGPEKEER